MQPLVQTLPANPLDIVGDVHGEVTALDELLHHLGYAQDGSHPQQRKLVFLGDLVDRGLDSDGVLRQVKRLVENGNAWCILGNHELNLLRDDAKDGSGWFFDERYSLDQRFYGNVVRTPASEKAAVRQFLDRLPLVLWRDDIRIVHAVWADAAIDAVRAQPCGQAADLYRTWDEAMRSAVLASGLWARYQDEKTRWASQLEDPSCAMPLLDAMAEYESLKTVANPVKMLTSGMETPASQPFFAANRWRFSVRTPWWDDYTDDTPVVIGHYWRLLADCDTQQAPERASMFQGVHSLAWFGRHRNVFCVDYSVGARWRDRQAGRPERESRFHLAALRWPERQLVVDDGRVLPTQDFRAVG